MNRQTKIGISLFFLCLITRVSFKLLSGYDNFQLFEDSIRYDILSNQILAGNYNLDIVAYLAAPLYIYTLALFKSISISHWESIAVMYQFILISFSAIYIYKITKAVFRNELRSIVAAVIYIFYPLTLWYNFTLTQETSFQAFFIFFIYHFINLCKQANFKNIILTTFFFAIALLTKSHILMLVPLLALILFLHIGLKKAILFVTIVFLYTLPHGIYNKKVHKVYTFSSHGNASFFLLGHSDETYECFVKPHQNLDKKSSKVCDPTFVFDRNYEFKKHGQVNKLPVIQRDKLRLEMAFEWIKANPSKFLDLKIFGFKRFILPGLDYNLYSFTHWLMSFIAGLLIYLPAYYLIYKALRQEWMDHLLIVSLILMAGAIFIIFFPVNRFRVITLEPLLIVYASGLYYMGIKKWFPKLIQEPSYN